MSLQAYSLREMQDRLDEMIEGTLKASGPGSQKRLTFNHFIGKCLSSISDETLDDFIGHVTSYTRQCMELSSTVEPGRARHWYKHVPASSACARLLPAYFLYS